eukprot:364173-Chlamydomonas_euryale.AAC.6
MFPQPNRKIIIPERLSISAGDSDVSWARMVNIGHHAYTNITYVASAVLPSLAQLSFQPPLRRSRPPQPPPASG